MEKSNFDNLLERYMKDQVSEEEKVKIEAWLDSMKGDDKKAFVWGKEDEEELFKKITKNIDNVQEIISYHPRKISEPNINRWLAVAATLLLLVTVSLVVWRIVGNDTPTIETIAVNDIEKLILEDGTIVWLHKNSKLTYHKKTNQGTRHVELKGEALFEVAKDPNNPFSIECGDITVKVLGTSFSLRTGEESIELTVLTGKVNLSSVEDKLGIDVSPYEKAIYTESGMIEKIPLEKKDIESVIATTEYDMNFENSPLQDVLSKIEKKFDVKMIIATGDFSKCRVTTDLSDQSLELTLQSLNELVKLNYKINNNSVVISGQGCN